MAMVMLHIFNFVLTFSCVLCVLCLHN